MLISAKRTVGAGLLVIFLRATCAGVETPHVIDDFSDASRWTVVDTEGVDFDCKEERVSNGETGHQSVLRLDINFASGGGFAGIRRELPLDLPANFEVAFSVRGNLPRNNLEVKLVDETGENVWWVNRRGFEFPNKWTRLASRRRHFQFAWGPSNIPIKRVSAIEIIIASAEGGRGTIFLDDLTFRPLPKTRPYRGSPTGSASSEAGRRSAAKFAIDGNADTAWQSSRTDVKPELTIDFDTVREFGGLVVKWDPSAFAAGYEVQLSDDGKNWISARTVAAGSGQPQFLSLPDSEARAVRLAIEPPKRGNHVAVREIEILPLAASSDRNEFAAVIARRSPRGHFPRAMLGEGTFWTIVGASGSDREALISEDGAIEVDKQAFSIEPFLFVDGELLTWADANTTQSLAEGHAPLPTVIREHDGLSMSVTAAAEGRRDDSTLLVRYTVTNTSANRVQGKFFLAIRPFQVNPPYQWLNAVGGVAPISRITLHKSRGTIDVDERQVTLGQSPDGFGSAEFDEGDVTSFLSRGQTPPHSTVSDPQRAASAAIRYDFNFEPAQKQSWVLRIPFSRGKEKEPAFGPLLDDGDSVEHVRRRQQAVAEEWVRATSTFDLILPAEAADIANTIRSTLAYILINRDGAAIQPGSRSYERSWIRDGSLTAAALLRFGLEGPAREFVDWYATHQFDSGKIPCVVDRRGPDPVPENDSHGQFIMAVMNVFHFSGDESFLRKHWPRVKNAVAYIELLRAQRMTAEYADPKTSATHQEPNKPAVSPHAFYGLMPESISHEGYSAKPMHSYWDDFFTLRGLKDAAEMARVLGEETDARRYQMLADDFASTLYASIDQAMQAHKIDYIPGCVELGDFDATSTTIALWPCGEAGRLPRRALDRTFDLYWEQFLRRRDDPTFAWTAYTPYELRCVGSLVLLGQIQRAHEALEFFMNDRLPRGWNQWPEVVHRERRAARFVGDMPHTWCGSDFLNSVRMMFLYEREADDALVLLAGVPETWISTRPVGFRNMPTYGGRLSCTIECANERNSQFRARIEGTCRVPNGGIRLTRPSASSLPATVNGKTAEIDADGRVVVRGLPATVVLSAAPSETR